MTLDSLELQNKQQKKIYKKLHEIGKSLNETISQDSLFDTACSFVTEELGFEKCLIFIHDDINGWFKVKKSIGYTNPMQQRIISIINLLLSGEVIEYLRKSKVPIIHTQENPDSIVVELVKSLFLKECYFELFGGDIDIPHGLLVVGNESSQYTKMNSDEMIMLALGNFVTQLSNTINNIIFYQAWQEEKLKLNENISKRTKQLEEQKRVFEAIYKTTKDGIAILDIETTAFLDVNDAYAHMTGYTKEELLRTSCLKLSIDEDKIRSREAIKEVKEKGYITDFIKTCIIKDGSNIITNMSISIMQDKKTMLISVKDITKQKAIEKEVAQIHKNTRDAIEYASLIQSALMPDDDVMNNYFKDHFVIWSPKDTVGGDIWLFNSLRHEDECLLLFIDCTGHSVPGAFVTMIVKSIEREIVSKIIKHPDMDISPALIMGYFNSTMKTLLRQENKDSLSNAGWDGGIIYYNRREQILKFAGAETPLFYVEDEELKFIKGNRYSVGYKKCDMDYRYTETILHVKEGMKFYCTTDGYLDQNGGEKGFPFGKKRFSKIIDNTHTKSMLEQKKVFLSKIKEYENISKEDIGRNDDITLIGFEIDKKSDFIETNIQEIIKYEGMITQNVIASCTENIEYKVTDIGIGVKLTTISIELLQNMMHYSKSEDLECEKIIPYGKIEIIKVNSHKYKLLSNNIVSLKDKKKMESLLLEIDALDLVGIKKRYKELRKSGENTHTKGGGIGFYEIAKLVSSFEYKFIQINEDKFSFQYTAIVEKKKK